uniref:Uncharacterized protein n=1 Tax=Cygnus columbianus parvoviridae sp. TaxID=2794474 RepID=A0A8A4XCQ9_9VIRU|nr:MAG: hypothetical protein [Cygnus columbianus parvoviridae sp.]
MEENIELDTIRRTLIHLLKPMSTLEAQPDRMKRLRLKKMVTQMEEKKDCETPLMLATLLNSSLGEPSSPQSIQIPLKPEKDLYDTLLISTNELPIQEKPSPSLVQSTITTFTSSTAARQPDSVDASSGSNAFTGVPFARVQLPFQIPTEHRSESIWLRAQDGNSYSGQIDLGQANYIVKKHLMVWDTQRATWRATHIWSEALDENQRQTYIDAFMNLSQTIPPEKWNAKEATPRSFNRYTGSKREWNRNGQHRYRPF